MSESPRATLGQWRERVRRELDGAAPESLGSDTACGQYLEPLYVEAPDHATALPCRAAVEDTKGGAAQTRWRRCQRYDDADAEVASAQVAADVAGGIDAVWIRLDRAARLGLDPSAEVSAADIGADGIALWDVESLAPLLQAAAPAGRELWIDAGGNALPAAALTVAALERIDVDPADVHLRCCADPLAALAADGSIPADHATLGWEAAILARICAHRWGHARALVVSTAPYARAGASAAQGLGVALATATQYLRYLAAAGVSPQNGVAQIAFTLELDRDVLVQVALLRALRVAWSKVQSACGMPSAPALVHAVTGWRTQSRRDPCVNMLRGGVQTIAAAMGGADTVTTIPFDAVLGRPQPRGWRVARNTHAVLQEESHLGEVLDPAAGSAAVETLTDRLARSAWDLLRRIDARGMAATLGPDRIDPALSEPLVAAARERRRQIADGDEAVLGVSRFAVADASQAQGSPPDLGRIRAHVASTSAARESPEKALSRVRELGVRPINDAGPEPLFDALLVAARGGATLHELGSALRPGAVPQHSRPLQAWRDTDAVEAG